MRNLEDSRREELIGRFRRTEYNSNRPVGKTMDCAHCGEDLWRMPLNITRCPYCGEELGSPIKRYVENPTSLWYMVPLFLGIIGGVLSYIVLKDENRDMANNMLLVGIVTTIIVIIFFAVYWGIMISLLF